MFSTSVIIVLIIGLVIYFLLSPYKKTIKPNDEVKIVEPKNAPTDTIIDFESSKYQSRKNKWSDEQADSLLKHITLTELLQVKDVYSIGYSDLLKCIDWNYKRLRVLVRDAFTCQDCKKESLNLHVHHLYYLKDKLPWEIDDSGLLSLCPSCHKLRHDKERIPVYLLINKTFRPTNNYIGYCSRCNGSGYLDQYRHVQNGICFQCHGNCIDRTIFSTRLNKVKEDESIYNIDNTLNEIITFLNDISTEQFKTKIHPAWDDYFNLAFLTTPHNQIPFRKTNSDDDLPF